MRSTKDKKEEAAVPFLYLPKDEEVEGKRREKKIVLKKRMMIS